MIETGRDRVDPRIIEGLEFRGIVALLIKDVVIRPAVSPYPDDKAWECRVSLNAPSSHDGHWTLVQFSQIFTENDYRLRQHSEKLTSRQAMVLVCLREMWQHEWDEAIWLNGKPMTDPHPKGMGPYA